MEQKPHLLYREIGPDDFSGNELSLPAAFYMAVTAGTAIVQINFKHFFLEYQSEIHQFNPCTIVVHQMSDDFQGRLFIYDKALLGPLLNSLGYFWYDFFDSNSFYQHTPDARSQRTWREFNQWLDMAQFLFAPGCKLKFPQLQRESFLSGYWMWATSTVQEEMSQKNGFSPMLRIYRNFLKLVQQDAPTHHNVGYYAQILCISPRYLGRIVSEFSEGKSPKQIIDAALLDRVKELLRQPSLSIDQIADKLNFPDQSYLSRFFRRLTGLYPSAYRASLS
ncbi:MAG: helix-turn-helix domain-containing protein [Bacteroidales bacterium]|nr:helix-turn-helix domain-containing protein [Bacteroidales bacterium]